eukprot:8407913-Ditylum_brightwellii.AAC.1
MNISGTLSAPFLRNNLPPTTNILKDQPTFKIKLQEEEHKYGLYTWTRTNGSTQDQDIDFAASFTPTSFFENIRFLLAIAAAEIMLIFPVDVSNAFQTNIEFNPLDQVHIIIPPFYLEYFFTKWPDQPLKGTPVDKLCIQALHSMQGSKDA